MACTLVYVIFLVYYSIQYLCDTTFDEILIARF